jgi:uncharacterized protein DUF6455
LIRIKARCARARSAGHPATFVESVIMSWPMFARVERQSRRLDEMIEQLEINPAAAARRAGGLAFAQARSRCLMCTHAHLCRFWLDQAGTAPQTPEFCPNAAYLEACRWQPACPVR